MRSTKRPRRPVHRYRSLLFPGIALLAVFAFWAAFAPAEKGETVLFEKDGLSLEITGVHDAGGFLVRFDPDRRIYQPIDTYHVYPGSGLTVLDASGETGRWELRRESGEALALTDGMDPVELTRDFDYACIYDLDTGFILLSLNVRQEDEDCWK